MSAIARAGKKFSTNKFIASLVCVAAISGCEQQVSFSEGADELGFSEASSATKKANKKVAEQLPLQDMLDFEQARKGLIATSDSLQITAADGRLAWDQDAYSFIAGDAPATVNPSLWRQAQLNGIHGLFEVTPGVYQLRGFDLANLTLIDTDSGWVVVDPLTSSATSKYAIEFARKHLGDKPIKAVIFTHSHVDHFGGIEGVLTPAERADIMIIAPEGFTEESVSENIMAGTVMGRRSEFMYGRNLPKTARGHIGSGLGKEPANAGVISILPPTTIIHKTGQSLIVDGLDIVFQNAPGSEAPAELTFYLPKYKAYCGAEVVSRTMHNLYTLRGAKVRDALSWSGYIDEALDLFGKQADVYFGSHHWPVWGNENVQKFIERQRDTYKFIHDQTMRLANKGYTPKEIAEEIKMPEALQQTFDNRGYYGTLKHNSKAVYQFYFGWYDANPVNLDPLPPVAAGQRYVEAMGGAESVLTLARASFSKGEYRWTAELLNHLVFTDAENLEARQLLANTYDQLGYQAESAPWRDVYLSGALELRQGKKVERVSMISDASGLIGQAPTELFFAAMATNLNPEKAAGKHYIVNIQMTDTNEEFVLTMENSVLHHRQLTADPKADVTIKITRELFLRLVTKTADMKEVIFGDELEIEGSKLSLVGFFSLFDSNDGNFNIVTP
jgi:alkyl sulfatase BDS1-like metallo-beta-lactamase superfamily hydrolase